MNDFSFKIDTSSEADIKIALSKRPDAVLDFIASDLEVSLAEIIYCLPKPQVLTLSGDQFEAVMHGVSELGTITMIVHTKDIVLECKGQVPRGKLWSGLF